MTERLADIEARIHGVQQLGIVVNAMRGIAAARVQQARAQLEAVERYATTIAVAIGRALALVPDAPRVRSNHSGSPALVVFCAEQGFAGAFSQRVLDTVASDLAKSEVFLIGTRGAVVATERGVVPSWEHAMPSHAPGIPKLADTIAEALYQQIEKGQIDRLDAVFTETQPGHGTHVTRRRLFPVDMTRFPESVACNPPLVNLPPAALLSELTADYLHAQLCEAALQAFVAENQARMEAMAAARGQIERQLSAMQAKKRMIRQDEITEEIIELAAGETASR